MEFLQDILAAIGVVLNGIPQGLLALSMGFEMCIRDSLPPAHIKERSAPFYLYSCRSLWHAFSIEGRCEQSLIETLTFL